MKLLCMTGSVLLLAQPLSLISRSPAASLLGAPLGTIIIVARALFVLLGIIALMARALILVIREAMPRLLGISIALGWLQGIIGRRLVVRARL